MKDSVFFFTLLFLNVIVNAQKSFSINEKGGPSVNCDAIAVNTESNIYEFTGNVDFKTENISIEKAQKVILNAKTRKVTATDCQKVTLTNKGTIHVNVNCKKGDIEYKLGRKRLLVGKNCH